MFQKTFYRKNQYKRWLFAFFIVLVAVFIYKEDFYKTRYNNKIERHIRSAFDKQHFKPEVLDQKEKILAFIDFLQKHAAALMSYNTHLDFKDIELDDDGSFLFRKKPETFHFDNEKTMYHYIPEKLRGNIKTYFDSFNGLITGFSIESPKMGNSLDYTKPNIRLRIKKDQEMYQRYITHSIYFNRKNLNTGDTASDNKDFLVKDTILNADTRYVIAAFLALIED